MPVWELFSPMFSIVASNFAVESLISTGGHDFSGETANASVKHQDGVPDISIASSSSRLLRQMNNETAVDLFVNPHPVPDVQVDLCPTAGSNSINQQERSSPVTGNARTNRQVRRMNSLDFFYLEFVQRCSLCRHALSEPVFLLAVIICRCPSLQGFCAVE